MRCDCSTAANSAPLTFLNFRAVFKLQHLWAEVLVVLLKFSCGVFTVLSARAQLAEQSTEWKPRARQPAESSRFCSSLCSASKSEWK